ncbi:hypothetical protein MHYP_G00005550 [Metynnis hypsauchen]
MQSAVMSCVSLCDSKALCSLILHENVSESESSFIGQVCYAYKEFGFGYRSSQCTVPDRHSHVENKVK